MRNKFLYWLIAILLLSACSNPAANTASLSGSSSLPSPQVRTLVSAPTLAPATQPSLLPTSTVPAIPSATPLPTASPIIAASPTAALHPMSIQALRQGSYPGSPITIEETLEPGANYQRYYASYLSEGYKIYALLTIPDGEMPSGGWPAIVFNHGYIPPNEYRTTERYIAYVDSLARHGYIVFRIDYRGHDRSEGPASGAYGDPGYTIDVMNAVASLKQLPQADAGRIGMWGHSMGGFLTLRAMVASQDIRAGVIWAGVVGSYPDMLYRWRRSSGPTPTPNPSFPRRWRNDWVERFGTPEDNPQFWSEISANSYLADLSGPIQLHHGDADDTVPLRFSQDLYNQIQQAGQTAEYYTYPGDNHNLSGFFSTAMTRTLNFYDTYLKNP